MAKLKKTHHNEIQQVLKHAGLMEKVNQLLADQGLSHVKVEQIKLYVEEDSNKSHLVDKKPKLSGCVEVCTISGICRWQC